MKFIDEYRNPQAIQHYLDEIRQLVTRPWRLMEVCGGQTHAIVKFGLDELLPDAVELIHGPGCPVCVTPTPIIDQAIELASRPEVIFCSFGDMLRVPGSEKDLLMVRAEGGDVRMVYSPMEAVTLAQQNPDREVVFFAVGFETTAPANAMAIYQAAQQQVPNFSMLVAHVLVPPAIAAILASPTHQIDGFLAAGHVCTVMGTQEYDPLAAQYRVPIVVTGFEPLDILQGVAMCLRQLESGQHTVENQYARSVSAAGNPTAQRILQEVFTVVPREWRGMGEIPASGLGLAPAYARFDARDRFNLAPQRPEPDSPCISGLILQGLQKPHNCPAFGTTCTPEHPLGATMVSSEGSCAAYYRYRWQAPAGASA